MKKLILILTLISNITIYSQEYNVSKTEVLVDVQKNNWSQTTENAFVESINFIDGGSIEITLPDKEIILIYKLEINYKTDKDGYKVMTFFPNLVRGSNSEIEVTLINGKPAFAYGHSLGWEKSNPNKITIFRLWF
ncbi:hypothetical protein ACFO3U_03130 [Flavobacterium ponti]|uniref:DUF3244 domain-containing protein n=1 Tax=Flavobacterium ponti TaxID=665133 RepID=A0ABV9P0C0_9FLAO